MNGGTTLVGEVRSLLREAIDTYRDDAETTRLLRRQLDRMDEPLRVAISGKVKAGKSTLLNALVGEEIAPTDAGECTRVVTWYRHGHHPRITLHPLDGPPRQLPVNRVDGALVIELDGVRPDAVDRLTVDWPATGLCAPSGCGKYSASRIRPRWRYTAVDVDAEPVESVLVKW